MRQQSFCEKDSEGSRLYILSENIKRILCGVFVDLLFCGIIIL